MKYYDGSGWAAGTWAEDEKAGNFLAVDISAATGSTIKVEFIGGTAKSVNLDGNSDYLVARIDSTRKGFKITATKDGVRQIENIYFDLTLEAANA